LTRADGDFTTEDREIDENGAARVAPFLFLGIEKEEKSNAEAQRAPRSAEKRNPRAHTECLCHERKEGGVKPPLHKQEEVTQESTIYGAPTKSRAE
jgi:hypothetical protein